MMDQVQSKVADSSPATLLKIESIPRIMLF